MNRTHVIRKPLVTEKTTLLSEQGYYTFEVDTRSTKKDIRQAVEKYFDVKVASVRTMVCRKEGKRTRLGVGKVRYWKKALVKLVPGEKITLFEGA